MNIFEYAMQMETDGRDFYLKHAETVGHPALKQILVQLADDELKHYNIFKAMKDGGTAEYKEAERTTILATVKNVFQELKDEGKEFSFAAEAKQIWIEAREVEKKAEEFYREKANEVEGDDQKHILNRIADEERRHWVTMENVIQFLDRPQHWLEDAEWNNLEAY
ncbi:MAG: ferritin family protein [candidate division Zixibacteria bacterium]|nr:ferritin family protein [candidate division Zixibacteria bacterium]